MFAPVVSTVIPPIGLRLAPEVVESSFCEPPRNVEKTDCDPEQLISVTKASLAPPIVDWVAFVTGKFDDPVCPVT